VRDPGAAGALKAPRERGGPVAQREQGNP
jgi:hypothetical protein